MPIAQRRPTRWVWALNVLLVVLAIAAVPSLRGQHAYAAVDVRWWWLVFVFVIAQTYALNFEFRQQAFQVALETVPLVLGLMFLPPLELVAVRTGACAIVYATVHRQPLVKYWFNVATTAVSTIVAIEVFQWLARSTTGCTRAYGRRRSCHFDRRSRCRSVPAAGPLDHRRRLRPAPVDEGRRLRSDRQRGDDLPRAVHRSGTRLRPGHGVGDLSGHHPVDRRLADLPPAGRTRGRARSAVRGRPRARADRRRPL